MKDFVKIDAKAVLETCARIEGTVAKVYRVLAGAHVSSPMLVGLWRKTADDEDSHERQIRFVIDNYDETKNVILVVPGRAETGLKAAEAVLAAIDKNMPAPVPALKMALELEELFKVFHAENATLHTDPTLKTLFATLKTGDDHHIGALKTALAGLEKGAN